MRLTQQTHHLLGALWIAFSMKGSSTFYLPHRKKYACEEWQAEVRAEVSGWEELPCAKPDTSHRDQHGTTTSIYSSVYKMPKNLLAGHSPLPYNPLD